MWTLRQNNNLGSRIQSLRIVQNIYSPNRFYLTFTNDNSWNFDKIVNVIKNLIFTLYTNLWFFLFFGWFYLALFLICLKTFLTTVNKCKIIKIMIIITINVKSFLERHFCGFRKQTYFCEKKLYYIQLLWRTAKIDRFYGIYLVLTKEMA